MLSDWMSVLAALPPSVELLVKLTALLTVAWIFKPLLSRANPRWQAFYWRGVAATALLLPVVVLVGPTVPVPLFEGPQREAVESRSAALLQQTPDPRQALPGKAGVADAVVVTRETAVAGDIALTPRESETSVAVQVHSPSAHPSRWHRSLAVAWFLPASFLLAGTLFSEWRTARLVRQAEKAPETTTQLLARVARALEYDRSIRVRISSQVDSPLVTGWFRPSILLPEAFDDEDQTDLRGIFAHEVNHLASHDLVWSRVIQFLSIGLWFHPLVWGLGRQHLDACERASDAAAAEYVGDADADAGTLARVALGVIGQGRALAGIAMARKPRIQQRLLRLGKGITATPLRRRHVIPVVAGGLILVTAVGGLRLVEARGPAPAHQARPAEAATQATVSSQRPDAVEAEQVAPEPVTESCGPRTIAPRRTLSNLA
jgi:beta-lactamase regulating signal transducer with metallopeptidase domain